MINSGMDMKFESDPYDVELHSILTMSEYENLINKINDAIKPARSTKTDVALLAMGLLALPFWAIRNKKQKKLRKGLMEDFIRDFNENNERGLYMRFTRRPEKILSIEPKQNLLSRDQQVAQAQADVLRVTNAANNAANLPAPRSKLLPKSMFDDFGSPSENVAAMPPRPPSETQMDLINFKTD
jgi:hypothetical protein